MINLRKFIYNTVKRYSFNVIQVEEKECRTKKQRNYFQLNHESKFPKPRGNNTLSSRKTLQKNNIRKAPHDKL